MAGLNVLVVNAGSSSFKASLFALEQRADDGDEPSGLLWKRSADSPADVEELISTIWTGKTKVLQSAEDIDVVGHRVVFGGAELFESTRIDDGVRSQLARVEEYAPAHNAAALKAIEASMRIFGERVPQIAVFDTAFHRTMPENAYTYAGPYVWLEQGIRRFGFHGLSHRYSAHRAARMVSSPASDFRVVTCHLGSGCSLAAVRGGRSVDTTMGFTPLDGIPMARRSGAVDPGILLHLLRHGVHTIDSLDHLLNHDSGLAGLSGTSGDMREVLSAIDAGDKRSKLALDVFVHHLCQGIASMAASAGGIDALVFTGGVGENAPRVRLAVCERLKFLGVVVNSTLNASHAGEGIVSDQSSNVSVIVIPAEENWIIAQECLLATTGR